MILGELDEELENVWHSGGLDEHDYEHMKETMEAMLDATKSQFSVPKTRNLFSVERLKRVPWIAHSKKQQELVAFLEQHFVVRRGVCDCETQRRPVLQEMVFEPSSYLMRQGDSVDGIYYVVSGVCRFAVRCRSVLPCLAWWAIRFAALRRQEDGQLKPLHLIYAGRFTGESALFASASDPSRVQAELPRRSGSVYAETSVVTKFLPAAHVLQ